MLKERNALRFSFFALAIFGCYFVFGMLQEKITRGKYGQNDKFTCALTLVLIQSLVNYIFAQILMSMLPVWCAKKIVINIFATSTVAIDILVVIMNLFLSMLVSQHHPSNYILILKKGQHHKWVLSAACATTLKDFMAFFQAIACNFIWLLLSWKHEVDKTRGIYYFSSALTYILAMVCSIMALQWVNYPTQVVGKAAKPIPVMILGVLIGRKSYPMKKYLFVLLIVIGIVLFMYKDRVEKTTDESQGFGIGELLLLLSLIMDGLTGAVQERIKSESSPTAYSMMLNTNLWGAIISGVGVLFSGELIKFVAFVSQYPEIIVYIVAFALMGALGQLFIFFMVSEFGPLPCSVVTTTRKFFTVLASVIIFGNVLLGRQWVGAILVFSGLFLDVIYSKSKSKGHQPKRVAGK